jgi:hypothetical protein
MNDVLLISEQTLKNDSLIGDNVESVLILPAIIIAQEQGLQPVIGTKLLRKLQDLIVDNSILSPTNLAYKELLDTYITIYLEYKVMSEIQIPLSYKMRNSGVIQNQDDKQITLSLKDVMFVKQFYDDKALWFSKRLSNYLCTNSTLYPEYKSYDTVADVNASERHYNSGICLGQKVKLNK